MSKHTTGPWIAYETQIVKARVKIQQSRGTMETNEYPIASVNTNLPEQEARANARLIAAAPELLRELRRCLIELSGWCENEAVPDEVSIEMATRMGHINTLLNKATE
jgi:hypothetical protein